MYDVIEGEVSYTFANGDVYGGTMSKNKFSGYGVYTTTKGDKYEGEFLNVIELPLLRFLSRTHSCISILLYLSLSLCL